MTKNLTFATDAECAERRQHLIAIGIINPGSGKAPTKNSGTFEPAPRKERRININDIPEDGSYRCRPIRNDDQYERRRQNYLHMLQSVLRARRDLKLEFEPMRGHKKD